MPKRTPKTKKPKIIHLPVTVPREGVETYIHEDSLEWLVKRPKALCHSIYGPFKRTA